MTESSNSRGTAIPYQTNIENHGSYLCVEVSGTRKPDTEHDEAIATWGPILAECRSAGLVRMLIRYRMHGHFSLMHAFDLSNKPEQLGWMRSLRIAIARLEGTPVDELRAVETVAVNRGFPMRVFEDESAAKDWLLSEN